MEFRDKHENSIVGTKVAKKEFYNMNTLWAIKLCWGPVMVGRERNFEDLMLESQTTFNKQILSGDVFLGQPLTIIRK